VTASGELMGVVMGAENREDGRAEMLLIASDEAASAPAETRVEKRLRATFEQFEDIHLPRGLEGSCRDSASGGSTTTLSASLSLKARHSLSR